MLQTDRADYLTSTLPLQLPLYWCYFCSAEEKISCRGCSELEMKGSVRADCDADWNRDTWAHMGRSGIEFLAKVHGFHSFAS